MKGRREAWRKVDRTSNADSGKNSMLNDDLIKLTFSCLYDPRLEAYLPMSGAVAEKVAGATKIVVCGGNGFLGTFLYRPWGPSQLTIF